MLNQTTNTRFSKIRKENATENAIAQMQDFEASEADEDDDYSAPHQPTPTSRTRTSRVSSLDGPAQQGCNTSCGPMICGSGHFRKQERIMRKFVRDPNVNTNQV